MQDTGSRRIKRSIYIDMDSVKFLDEKMIEKLKKIKVLSDYISKKEKEIEEYNKKLDIDNSVTVNGRRMTNLGVFRAYMKEYLKNREDIHKGFTFLVRQLPPGPNGLPIEIYVFATTTAWVDYEEIQADIFVRANKLVGNEVYYICAIDCHGTPVMLKAMEENITPEALVETLRQEHIRDIKSFFIDMSIYDKTHSDYNREVVEYIFTKLKNKGDIVLKKGTQYQLSIYETSNVPANLKMTWVENISRNQ